MTTEETVVRLTQEIETIQQQMTDTSRFAAVSDINDQKDPLSAARKLLELREILKIKRIALSEAKQLLDAEILAASKAECDADRDHICELTNQLEDEAKKLLTSVKKISRHYTTIIEIEHQIKHLGLTATDWPDDAFKYMRPGDLTYRFLVHALAAHIDLSNLPINQWPSNGKAKEVADIAEAFNGYLFWREEWLCRDEETAVEEINHVS